MTARANALDDWIRSDFKTMNTQLEELYFAGREATANLGVSIKQKLVEDGRVLIADLLAEGNTDEGFDSGFELLGDCLLYTSPSPRD